MFDDSLWVLLTIGAVFMQSVRTAGQKALTRDLDAMGATFVRFLFGLPFVVAMLYAVIAYTGAPIPQLHGTFLISALISGILQIIATVLLVHLFSLRNFAVGTAFARTEAFLTAIIGAAFFGEFVTGVGWVSIVISVGGVIALTVAGTRKSDDTRIRSLIDRSVVIGLACGLSFAFCSLFLRRASLSLEGDWMIRAFTTLVVMVTMQTVILGVWFAFKRRDQFRRMFSRWQLCTFVGATSALGSAGWFTAMTLERASYVKALGQIEFLVALVISGSFFKETTTRLELLGMTAVGFGVILLVLLG